MSRILIIEDEMLIAVTLEAMLVDLGHQVVGMAKSLDEAMEMVASTDFDVAILDLRLGNDMTFSVADRLVALGKRFIFSTGFGEAELDGRYSQPVLQKPYDEAALAALIPACPRRSVSPDHQRAFERRDIGKQQVMVLEDLYRLMKTGHVQAQGVVDTMTQPVVVLDHNLSVTTANNAFIKTFKVDRDDILSQNFFSLGNGQWDIPELRQLISAVIPRAAAVIGFEVTHDFPTIGERTFLVDARRLVHPDDNSPNILIIFDDVTERQRHDAEMDFIVAEMRHRIKNMAAVVRSVVTNTRADEPAVADFKDALLGRLDATFNAQDIAARAESADFEFLVTQAVASSVAERLQLSGPAAEVSSGRVLPVSMIFHELATNAIKYGSLSVSEGRVHLSWELEPSSRGRPVIVCRWREKGGPTVRVPERKGYGTELMEGLASHLAGSVELTYPSEGLAATIKIPM